MNGTQWMVCSGGLAPIAKTQAATNISTMSATLNGTVNANGLSTTVIFKYGTSTNYESSDTASQSPITGNTDTSVSADITGLTMGTTYYVRAYASNNVGTQYGNEIVFETQTSGTVTDIEGNSYKTITIGNQDWMAENLKVTKFNDSKEIPNITDGCSWFNSTTPEYCWNNDDISYKDNLGGLYNWYTVNPESNSGKNVCPSGWHVPTAEEWNILEQYLINNGFGYEGGSRIVKALADKSGWNNADELDSPGHNPSTNNLSGFSALATGGRVANNNNCLSFMYIGATTRWWCAPVDNDETCWSRELSWFSGVFGRDNSQKNWGQSIRCLKD